MNDFISAPVIQKIQEDGSTISSDAYYFNPQRVVWMKSRVVGTRPYVIIKLEETEPFMAEGSIETYLTAMGVTEHPIYGWDYDEEDEEYE